MKKVFHSALIEGDLKGKPVENAYMTDLLQALIDSGIPVSSVPISHPWVEVDTVDDLKLDETLSRVNKISEFL